MSVSRAGDWERLGLTAEKLADLVAWLPGAPVTGITIGPAPRNTWHGSGAGYVGRINLDEDGHATVIVSGPLSATLPEHAASSFGAFLGRMVAQAYAQATAQPATAKDVAQAERWSSLVSMVLHAPFSGPCQDWREAVANSLMGMRSTRTETADKAVDVMAEHFASMDQAADPNIFLRGYQSQLAEVDSDVRRIGLRNTLQDRLSDPAVRSLSLRVLDQDLDSMQNNPIEPVTEDDVVLRNARELARALSVAAEPFSHPASIRQVGEYAHALDRKWRAIPIAERRAYRPELIRALRYVSGSC